MQFPWLVYSRQDHGGYCLPCVFFHHADIKGQKPGILVSHAFTTCNKALELCHKHANKSHHKDAIVHADDFVKVMTNQQPSISHQLNQTLAERVATNRQKLHSIFDTIILCG